MAGLVPAIHALLRRQDVDARHKAGHDSRAWRNRPEKQPLTLAGPARLRLQRRDPGLQRLVFLPGEPRHLLDGLELVAPDHVEVGEDALGLAAKQGVELAAHALGFDRGGAATVVTRFPATLAAEGGFTDETVALAPGTWQDVLTHREFTAAQDAPVALAELLDTYPVAILRRKDS